MTEVRSDAEDIHDQFADQDGFDSTVVADDIRTDILGSYYRIEGPELGRYVLVDEFEHLGARDDAEDILVRARSL